MENPHSTESSRALSELDLTVRARISASGGWMGFDDFMALALYTPGQGYYSGPARKFGAKGDFVTAPEISPLFGACLAQQIAAWMEAGQLDHLVEFGAGTGQLATQVLNELARLGCPPRRYSIIELSADLQARQRKTLETLAPHAAHKVQWLGEIPRDLKAIVFANELLDAMPVRLFAWDGEALFERGVALNTQQALQWSDRAASAEFKREVQDSLTLAGIESLADLPAPYISEVPQQAKAWMLTLADHLEEGCLLTFDYGFPGREFFHPQRHRGTLACHYQHRVGFDPFQHVGMQDITAHVDFTAINHAALQAGFTLGGFCSQARFLLSTGLLDRLSLQPIDETIAYAKQAHAVGKLLSEAEMGELFKAIAWVKSGDAPKKAKLLEASLAFEEGGRQL
jgi:SAM-dependent MidA family methyltransferase